MDLLAIFGVGTNLMFSLGIIFVIVFTLFYLRQRLSDYDSKLSDMIQVISGMNKEIIHIKTTFSQNMVGDSKKVELTTNRSINIIDDGDCGEEQNFYVNLSNKEGGDDDNEDDDDEDDDNEEDDDDEDEDEDEDGDEDEDEDDDNEDEDDEGDEDNNVKHVDCIENDLDNTVSMLLEKTENSRVVDLSDAVNNSNTSTTSDIDFTKMTIQELREHAVLKGLAIDPKAKKKAEIIELLYNA